MPSSVDRNEIFRIRFQKRLSWLLICLAFNVLINTESVVQYFSQKNDELTFVHHSLLVCGKDIDSRNSDEKSFVPFLGLVWVGSSTDDHSTLAFHFIYSLIPVSLDQFGDKGFEFFLSAVSNKGYLGRAPPCKTFSDT